MSRILFIGEQLNRQSVAALINALDRGGLLSRLAVQLCSFAEAERLAGELTRTHERVVFALSFLSVQKQAAFQCLARLREFIRTHDLVIAGGAHASAMPEETLRAGAEFVFRGEAERSFPLFMRSFLDREPLRELPGICILRENQLVMNAAPAPVELDESHTVRPERGWLSPLELTRGCFFRCHYCFTPRMFSGPVRHRSVKSILELAGNYPRYLNFISPNAFSYGAEAKGEVRIDRIVDMLGRVKERYPGLQIAFGVFPGEVRPEYVSRELVRSLLPFISNRYLAVGMQSGSDQVLGCIGRGHTVDDVAQAIEASRGEGLEVLVDVIFGLPGEDEAAEEETITFLSRHLGRKVKLRAHVFTPIPGTPFANATGRLGERSAAFLRKCHYNGLLSASPTHLQRILSSRCPGYC